MKSIFISFLICLSTNLFAQNNFSLVVDYYDLELSFDFNNSTLQGINKMKIINTSNDTIKQIPILLYRLMKADAINDENGNSLTFSQKVEQFEDFPPLQANHILINNTFYPNEIKHITIYYSGYLLGYEETGMNYVKDRISPNFTIIRNDAYSYPIIGKPSISFLRKNITSHYFNYELKVKVPDSLVVANGGNLISVSKQNGISEYEYISKSPSWRIDVAISSRYKEMNYQGLNIFYFEEDSIAADLLLENGIKAMNLYKSWWGELMNANSLTIIETEKNSGGQTDETTILLPQEAFTEQDNYGYLYHELSHLWNVKVTEKEGLSPRWEEGLATFSQYIVEEKLNLEKANLTKSMSNRSLKRLKSNLERTPELLNIPFIEFGNKQLTDYSYTHGMIMFSVLYYWLGETKFNEVIKEFYQNHYKTGATTLDFTTIWEKYAQNKNLKKFFNDWMYGTKYTEFVLKDMGLDEIINHYR